MLWKLAWQFTRKQIQRNLLVIGAVAVSVFVLVFLSGLMAGIRENFLTRTVSEGGHLRVFAEGWENRSDPLALSPTLLDPSALRAQISTIPGVVSTEEILPFGGVLQVGTKTWFTEIDGLTQKDFTAQAVEKRVRSGQFVLTNSTIIIDQEAAKLLGLQVGDSVILLTQDNNDMPFYRKYFVSGIYQAQGESESSGKAFISLAQAKYLTGLDRQGLEIRVQIKNPAQANLLRTSILQHLHPKNYEIQTWQEFQGSLLIFLKVFNVFIFGLDFFLIVVVATVIANVLLMNFLERIKVLATLRALGMRRQGVFGLVLREAWIQGGLGSFLGLVLGSLCVAGLAPQGLDFGAAGQAFGFGQTFPFKLDPLLVFQSGIVGVITVLIAATYAGLTGSRMSILDGLKES